MKILFVGSECWPYFKTGGLADVLGALPQEIAKLGHDTRIFLPFYKSLVEKRKEFPTKAIRKNLSYSVKFKDINYNIRSSRYPNTKIIVYFVETELFSEREGMYLKPGTNEDWNDNSLRFSFFSRAVLECLKLIDWKPDIIHINDWQTGLIPFYLKTIYRDDAFYKKIKTVFTIHNLAYQGNFPEREYWVLGVHKRHFTPETIEYWGKFSFLKAGLVYADWVTTVSPTYAQEILTPEQGCGMDGVLRDLFLKKRLTGILNGIDYAIWNPAKDIYLENKYEWTDLAGKKLTKLALQRRSGLKEDPCVPLIGIVSRLAYQKGFDILKDAFNSIIALPCQLILLGTGDPVYHDFFSKMDALYPHFVALLEFNNELAHLIEAGSDFFLMPSRYEPCGLNQMYSLRYGTIPIVRSTGGLADTVTDASNPKSGNGFVFHSYNSRSLYQAVKRAIDTFCSRPQLIKTLIQHGMEKDFSWQKSAEQYNEIYEKCLNI